MRRRQLLQLALPTIVGLWPFPVSAQVGEQPIRIVYPFAAGGAGDALVRMIADKMRDALGRSVVVENRTGGAGRIGVTAVKNAAPDGGTLLITPIAPMAVYQHVYKSLDYDPIDDFAAVSQLATFDFALAVGPQIPANSLSQFVAWAKADTSRAAFGTPATGDLTHFLGVLFGRATGLDLGHVCLPGLAPSGRRFDRWAYPCRDRANQRLGGDAQGKAGPHSGELRQGALAIYAGRADIPRGRLRYRGDQLVRGFCTRQDACRHDRPLQRCHDGCGSCA